MAAGTPTTSAAAAAALRAVVETVVVVEGPAASVPPEVVVPPSAVATAGAEVEGGMAVVRERGAFCCPREKTEKTEGGREWAE